MPDRSSVSTDDSAASPDAPRPTASHVAVIEAAHRDLGLTYDEIADAIGANASSLHRWRAGERAPSPIFRRHLTALAELTAALRAHLRRAGGPGATAADARAWWDAPVADVPGLGATPARALLAPGHLERLAALVTAAVTAAAPPKLGRPEPEGPRIERSGRPAGGRA